MKHSRKNTINVTIPLGTAIAGVFACIGFAVGSTPLSDNSFFTHLATGAIIWDTGSIPTVDPYTFHSLGHPWIVQSWLASAIYAGLEAGFGLVAVRFLQSLLAGGVALGIWYLARPAEGLISRVVIASTSLAACVPWWTERPLMISFACLVAMLILTDVGPVWLVMPVMWIWVNSHGSFPLGLLLVATVCIGRYLDNNSMQRIMRVLTLSILGTLVGGFLTPLPGKLLLFPIELLTRNSYFQNISEWQSPDFSSMWMKIFLVQVVLLIISLSVLKERPWERLLPSILALASALLGMRNVPVAALVFTISIAAAAPAFGDLRKDTKTPLAFVLLALSIFTATSFSYYIIRSEDLDLETYPIAAIEYLEREEILPSSDTRVAYPERVGNYLNYRYGPQGSTFFDDRFDMYPLQVLTDMFDLRRGRRTLNLLDQYDITYVIWLKGTATAEILSVSDHWQLLYDPPNASKSLGGLNPREYQLFVRKN